jgi:hypothetical protein
MLATIFLACCAALSAGFQGQTSSGQVIQATDRSPDEQDTTTAKRDRLMRSGNGIVLGSNGNTQKLRPTEAAKVFTQLASKTAAAGAAADPALYTGVTGFNENTCQYTDAGYNATELAPSSRRRTPAPGQEWDCDVAANHIIGNQPCWEVEIPLQTITDPFISANPDEWCKTFCLQLSAVTCTGFYYIEEGTLPGNDTNRHKCGFYTKDMLKGQLAVREYSASGHACLRVGKNFNCNEDHNMIETAEYREDFFLRDPPLLHPDGITPLDKDEALDWCKEQCDKPEIRCVTFWFQVRHQSVKHGLADIWQCGLYANPVDDSVKQLLPTTMAEGLASGCICDAV